MTKKTRPACAKSVQLGLAGVATVDADSVPPAPETACTETSVDAKAKGSPRKREQSSCDAATVRSGGSVIPRSKRPPSPEEAQWLRDWRVVYHRAEVFAEEAWALSRAAAILGYRHPMTSRFRWTPND